MNAVAWTPDGRQVIATSTRKGAEVLDTSGRLSRTYTAPADMVPALAWNPAGTVLATGGMDGQIVVWQGTVPLSRWQAHSGGATGLLGVNDLTFSPDGTRLVSGGQDGTLRFWTPGGKRLSNGTALSQYDARTGKMLRKILPASTFENAYTASFSADGGRFAFGKTDGTTELWSVDSRLNVRRLASFLGEGRVYKTAISPDGRFVAARRGESVSVFDVRRGAEVGTAWDLAAHSSALAFNPAGTRLAVGSGTAQRGGTVTVFKVQ